MSPNTTRRSATIYGMTNTDQVGMWQGPAAERIPDAGDINEAEHTEDSGGVDEATGLSGADLEAFRQMERGPAEPEPAGDAPAEGDPAEGDDDPAPAEGEADEDPEPAPAGKEKTPAELAAEAQAGKKPPPKQVAFGKYQRELNKAKAESAALTQQLTKEREDRIKLAERVAIINEAIAAQQAQAAQTPVDPNAPPENPFEEETIDPTVDYAASVQQLQRRQMYQMDHQTQLSQRTTETQEDARIRDTFTRDFQAQAAVDPQLPAAYQFLKDSRLTEICISEFDKDPNDPNEVFTPQQVQKMVQMFNTEEKWVVSNAIKANKSPAMAIMKLARARGFKPQLAPPPAAAPQVPPARPAAGLPAAPAVAAVPSAAEQLAALGAAREAGKSLSDGGGAPPQGLSAEMLLRLDDDAFAEMVDGMSERQLDAIMGRMPT